jgi:hypothetical protein
MPVGLHVQSGAIKPPRQYADKTCTRCGRAFQPRAGNHRTCESPECQESLQNRRHVRLGTISVPCLRCGRRFPAEWIGNRLCQGCKAVNLHYDACCEGVASW